MTPALRALKAAGTPFEVRPYRYEDKGGTAAASREIGLPEHQVIKTLVFQDDRADVFLVLMHGDRQVSTKKLARARGVKTVAPVDPAEAERITGYKVGGISPFGQKRDLPVLMEAGIMDLPVIAINAGRRGMLVTMDPRRLTEIVDPVPVQAAVDEGGSL